MRPPKLRRGLQHGFYDYLLTFAGTNADAQRAAYAPRRLVFEDEQWKLYRVQGLDSPE